MKDTLRNYYVGGRVFVIGTYGAGKTTFAKIYSEMYDLPLIVLDNKWQYTRAGDEEYVRRFIADIYPERFVGDNMPYCINSIHLDTPKFGMTLQFIKKKNVKVVCTVCSNPIVWLDRILDCGKAFYIIGSSESSRALVRETVEKMNRMTVMALKAFSDFYFKHLKQLIVGKIEFDVFDSFTNTFITKEEMYKRIDWARPNLIYSKVVRLKEFEGQHF